MELCDRDGNGRVLIEEPRARPLRAGEGAVRIASLQAEPDRFTEQLRSGVQYAGSRHVAGELRRMLFQRGDALVEIVESLIAAPQLQGGTAAQQMALGKEEELFMGAVVLDGGRERGDGTGGLCAECRRSLREFGVGR